MVKSCLHILGYSCNNSCIFCSVSHCRKNFSDKTTGQIKKELTELKKQGFLNIKLIGGEPTIRKDIFELVSYTKKLGYKKIALSSNGRMFCYRDFTKKILTAGLNTIDFSLYSHSSKIHDSITRTGGSFNQLIQGIINFRLFSNSSDQIHVATVLCRLNHKNLSSLAKILIDLTIKEWYVLALLPGYNDKDRYHGLFLDFKETSDAIGTLLPYAKKFKKISLMDFPFCILPKEILENKVFFPFGLNQHHSTQKIDFGSMRPTLDKAIKVFKTELSICLTCQMRCRCGGISNNYYRKYGEKILEEKIFDIQNNV